MLKFTGSQYKGETMDNLPHGKGIYIFPNGTIYEGQFYKGNFHGEGKLKYPEKGEVMGKWENGKLIEKTYKFEDDLIYQTDQWEYCNLSDRRFNNERNENLQPFGQQNLCDKSGILKNIPQGTYDIQNGFFDPIRKLVYNYDQTKVLYKANKEQVDNYVSKYKYTAQQQFINKIDGVFQKELRQILNKHGKQLKKLLQRNVDQQYYTKQNTSQNYLPRYSYVDKNQTQDFEQAKKHFEMMYEKRDAQIKILNKENIKLKNKLDSKKKINLELLKSLEEVVEFFLKRDDTQKQNFQSFQQYIINNFQNLLNKKSKTLQNKPLFKETIEFPKKILTQLLTKNQRKINALTDISNIFDFKSFSNIQNYVRNNLEIGSNLAESLPPQEINIKFPDSQILNIKRKKSIIPSYQSFDLTDILQKNDTSYTKEPLSINQTQEIVSFFQALQDFDFNSLDQADLDLLALHFLQLNHQLQDVLDCKQQMGGLKNQLKSYSEKLDFNQQKLNSFQKDINHVQRNCSEIQDENDNLENILKNLKNQWKDIHVHKEELQIVNRDLAEQIKEQQKLIKKEEMLKNYQQQSFRKSIEQMKQFEGQIVANKSNIKEQSQDLNDFQEEFINNEKEIKSMKQQIEFLKEQKEEYQNKLDDQNYILSKLDQKIHELQQNQEEHQNELNKIQKLQYQKKLILQKEQLKNNLIQKQIQEKNNNNNYQTDVTKNQEEVKELILRIMNVNFQDVKQKDVSLQFKKLKKNLKQLYQTLKQNKQNGNIDKLQDILQNLNIDIQNFNKTLNKNQMEEQMLQKEIKFLKTKNQYYKIQNINLSESIQQKNEEFSNISQSNLFLKSESLNMIKNELNSLKEFSQYQKSHKEFIEDNYQQIKDMCQEEKELKLNLSNIDRQNSNILDTSQREPFLRRDSTTDLLSQLNKLQTKQDTSANSISYQSNQKSLLQNNQSNSILQKDKNQPLLKKNFSSASQMQLKVNQSFVKKNTFGDELEKNWDKFVKILKKVLNCLFKSSCIISNTLTILVCKKDNKNHVNVLKKKIINFLKDSVKKHKQSIQQVKGYQNLQKLSYEGFYSILMKFLKIVQEESSKQEAFNLEIKNILNQLLNFYNIIIQNIYISRKDIAFYMQRETKLEDFKILSKLGEGAYGKVYKVQRISDQQYYALKIIDLKNMDKKEKQSSLNEVRILCSLNNPCIVGYKEAFIVNEKDQLCIVMEYLEGGDLSQLIEQQKKQNKFFKEDIIWKFLAQLILGLKHLHMKKIVHRDIKSANIFVSKDQQNLKIGDLNVAKVLKMNFAKTQIGTPYYLAPEIWNNELYDQRCDVFSLGVVAYEMATFKFPFDGKSIYELQTKIQRGKFQKLPKVFSYSLNSFISEMLEVNYRLRPKIDQLLQNAEIQKQIVQIGLQNFQEDESFVQNLMDTIRIPQSLEDLSFPKNKIYQAQSCQELNDNTDYSDDKLDNFSQIQKMNFKKKKNELTKKETLPKVKPPIKIKNQDNANNMKKDKTKQSEMVKRLVKLLSIRVKKTI